MSFNITHGRSSYPPFWVRASMVELLWPQDHRHVAEWKTNPKKAWFWGEKIQTADIDLVRDENNGFKISFINGRHRTRWLLESGSDRIPIGINEDHIDVAHSIGLILKKVDSADEISNSGHWIKMNQN